MALARPASTALDCADPAAFDPAGHPFCLSTQIPE
jgi:hypothetical protein